MALYKSNYAFVVKELKEVRVKIDHLRKIPVNSRGQHIQVISQINALLKKNNELLILRQRILKNKNKAIELKIERLVSRFT